MRIALALLPTLLASAAAVAVERPQYALIVSNNASNDPSLAPLRFADDDGARFHALLAPQSVEAILLTVLDPQTQARHPGLAARTRPPTRRELSSALTRLEKRMAQDVAEGREPVLFFVFTGHGKRGAAGEGSISLLGEEFTRTDLYEQVLARTNARRLHLIVDACDSYFFVNARGALPRAESYAGAVQAFLDERTLEKFPHVGVVLSTASQKESHEWAGISGGVFSHQVLSGLSGAADVNSDGRVEYSELRAFVAAASTRVADPRGRPEIFARPPAQDLSAPLTDLTRASGLSYLIVPAGIGGRHWVEDARGVRIADFHKEADRSIVLALPADRTFFLRSALREASFRTGPAGASVDAGSLAWRSATLAARGALDAEFREHLFSIAYGPKFYQGFAASTGEPPLAAPADPDLSP